MVTISSASKALKWGVERRLEFIEFRLLWEGGVNRSHIIDMFDVSVPQASKDLALYQERAPLNVVYDKRSKRYIASPQFLPTFLKPDPDSYLSRLRSITEGLVDAADSWIGKPPPTDIALTPRRQVDINVLRSVLGAVRDHQSIEIRYQSMSSEKTAPTTRRVTPHAFGHDGFRWHVRAYCHDSSKFKDFLLPRILAIGRPGKPGAEATQDKLWIETFDVEIAPHPGLTPSQRAVVAKDYGMRDGRDVLTVRYAMLFYVLKRLGLLGDATKQSARTQHIIDLNRPATEAALRYAEAQL